MPDGAVRPRFTSVLDLGIWSYTTVVADVRTPFDPVISDPESVALSWVPVEDVDALPLHPGFGAAWPMLRAQLSAHPVVVVDAANVVGSVPDGWWKDRAGAAARLRDRLTGLSVPADDLGLAGTPGSRRSRSSWKVARGTSRRPLRRITRGRRGRRSRSRELGPGRRARGGRR